MEEVEIAVFAKSFRIVISLGMLTLSSLFRTFSFVVVTVLAHSLGIVLKCFVWTHGDLFAVLG